MKEFIKRHEFLPYSSPMLDSDEFDAVLDVLKSRWLAKGPRTVEFEQKFAEYIGAKHAVAVNSCTAALHLSLLAAAIKQGDEVITTTMTFASTVNTIVHVGAIPVLVDVDPENFLIDPDRIEEKITDRTRAIVPVHYAGKACNMDKIKELAEKYKLFISEDAAHGLCTRYKGQLIGSESTAASFSFYATKNICTGEGGMLLTNREDIYQKAKLLSCHGMSSEAWKRYNRGGSWEYDIEEPGYKYNMFDIQAALGIKQLEKLESMQQRRRHIAQKYTEAFNDEEAVEVPRVPVNTENSWHLYIVQINSSLLKIKRNEVIAELNSLNIGTSVHFIPVHLMSYYRRTYGYGIGDFPVAEKYYNSIISLPLYPSMSDEDVDYVISAVKYIIKKYRK
ncbi:DegT/DnrJ/EryC1/StrS family aminotransferase [Clostridium oryzae]|uniref:UDP-4-amino-4-deoxy-L-arabinose--oxoglutarate aminotransferase n=1 Tax=Clostridium oryzae TaxID=1450648 RepID=A0A1V4IYN1_9CLOT|nr:DegT/DnrJ/EryC1/StrS family aminotransferase [Clostridium oryzae]OPJ65046.1 UDP-4-amino-4-deoxy-L-arabinose--oxoglutarate aminotransferase [Clostridium oryzae]